MQEARNAELDLLKMEQKELGDKMKKPLQYASINPFTCLIKYQRDKKAYEGIGEKIKSKENEIVYGINEIGFYSRYIKRNEGGLPPAGQALSFLPHPTTDSLAGSDALENDNPAAGLGGQSYIGDALQGNGGGFLLDNSRHIQNNNNNTTIKVVNKQALDPDHD